MDFNNSIPSIFDIETRKPSEYPADFLDQIDKHAQNQQKDKEITITLKTLKFSFTLAELIKVHKYFRSMANYSSQVYNELIRDLNCDPNKISFKRHFIVDLKKYMNKYSIDEIQNLIMKCQVDPSVRTSSMDVRKNLYSHLFYCICKAMKN